MINKESIISSFDDKPTLLAWLKKVEAALKGASASSFKVNKKGNATLTFSIVFDDGSEIESDPLTLEEGESVASAYIQNGNLHLVLTNGDDLDAGNMFNGNITISGNLTAGGVKTPSLNSDTEQIAAQKPVVEVMSGYRYEKSISDNVEITYAGMVKNGNKITLALAGRVTKASGFTTILGTFHFPLSVANKILPTTGNYVVNGRCALATNAFDTSFIKNYGIEKIQNEYFTIYLFALNSDLVADTSYMFRIEATFLLSDNLAA